VPGSVRAWVKALSVVGASSAAPAASKSQADEGRSHRSWRPEV
jgi:hypothetical protein